MRSERRCPCGSGRRYGECCEPLHRGRASGSPTARTAEDLMRSRFSAFAAADAQYLLDTWDPSTRPASLELDDDVLYQRLEIRSVEAGGPADDRGTVAFTAELRELATGAYAQHRERSRFRRRGGQWYYVGELPEDG